MGFLKKITRTISRVLDKIVPNEIKPALPFLAAAAPFMAPGIMGIGGNTMLSRALLSGGLNLGAQLAQEGSEGDFNPLSVALASGIGALSAPNAASTIRGVDPNFVGPQPAPEGILGQGREFLAKSAEFLGPTEGGVVDILGKGGTKAGFDMATAKAAAIPLTQGTMDLAFAEQNRLNKQQIIDDALGGLGEGASDADRALAIRLAMQQYGFSDDEISETIESAGYKDGGIIGLQVEMIEGKKDGGLMDLGGKEMDLRGGGFVPIGKKEKADDVPARLSKNEFVMTADAVRAAGGGSVNKGAKRMYDLMDRLEARA